MRMRRKPKTNHALAPHWGLNAFLLWLGFIFITPVVLSNGLKKKQARWSGGADLGTSIPQLRSQFSFVPHPGDQVFKVRFYANIAEGVAFITGNGEIIYSVGRVDSDLSAQVNERLNNWIFKETFIGGKVNKIYGRGRYRPSENSFETSDDSHPVNISGYSVLDLGEIYAGIEVKLVCYGDRIGKLVCVNPYADLSKLRVQVQGDIIISVDESGNLIMMSRQGEIGTPCPVAFQVINNRFRPVKLRFRVGRNSYGFQAGSYDRTRVLIIDPMINTEYSRTYDVFCEVTH